MSLKTKQGTIGGTGAAGGDTRYAQRSDEEQIPVIGLRRKIAQKMQDAKRRIPHFTYVEEIDVTELEALRGKPVAAVRGPEPAILAAHHDQRIQECGRLVDLECETLGMSGGQVALKRRGLQSSERQRCQHQCASAERISIGSDRRTTRQLRNGLTNRKQLSDLRGSGHWAVYFL